MSMTTTNVEEEVRRLTSLSADEFKAEADEDVRPFTYATILTDQSQWEARHAALRTPALVDRWFGSLSRTLKSVEGQLATKTEDYDADRAQIMQAILESEKVGNHARVKDLRIQAEQTKAAYSRARSTSLRFKTGLDETLIQARFLRDQVRDKLYDSVVAEERNRYAARITVLTDAIRAHREAHIAADLDSEIHDEHVWAVIT